MLHFHKNSWKNNIGFLISFMKGSFDEPKGKEGYTHFAEHLMFSGTEKFSKQELQNRFSLYFNRLEAQTGREHVAIFCFFDKRDFKEVIETLGEMIFNWECKNIIFNEEKTEILEEAKFFFMSDMNRQQKAIFKFLPLPQIPALGHTSSLQKIDAKQLPALKKFWNGLTKKSPRNLCVTGAVSKLQLQQLEKIFMKNITKKQQPVKKWQITEYQFFEDKYSMGFWYRSNQMHLLNLLLDQLFYLRSRDLNENIEYDFYQLRDITCFFLFSTKNIPQTKTLKSFFSLNISEKEFKNARERLLVSIDQMADTVDIIESLHWFNGFQEKNYYPISTPEKAKKYFEKLTFTEFKQYLEAIENEKLLK